MLFAVQEPQIEIVEVAQAEVIEIVVPARPETLEERIGRRAVEVGYDPVKAQSIAWAESRFNPNAKNTGSSASGIYQFIDGTFADYCIRKYKLATSTSQKNDPEIQIDCALQILTESPRGEDHWWPSRPYWHLYTPATTTEELYLERKGSLCESLNATTLNAECVAR